VAKNQFPTSEDCIAIIPPGADNSPSPFGAKMDIYGFIVLTVVLIVASAFQVAAMFGAMFALHNYAAHKVPPAPYGRFDFDHIDKAHLQELIVKLAAILYPPTILLHLLEFLTIGIYIRAYPFLVSLLLFILETAAIYAGIAFILKANRQRTIILTIVNALFYLLLYVGLIFTYLRD
jgi:hypothetical protein